jgi:hypothetical protein
MTHDHIEPAHLFERSLQVLSWVLEISRKPLFIGAHDAPGGTHQPLAVRVIARPTNHRAHCILRLFARRSLK